MDVLFHLWENHTPCDNVEALLKRSVKQQDALSNFKVYTLPELTIDILNLSGVETATLKALQKKED